MKVDLVAEAPACGDACAARIGAGASQSLFAQLHVESHLLGELGAQLLAAEEVAESAEE